MTDKKAVDIVSQGSFNTHYPITKISVGDIGTTGDLVTESNPLPMSSVSTPQDPNYSADNGTYEVLIGILQQLKVMNLHLSLMTDITISSQDVE